MANGGMDTVSLIIIICVLVPALIAVAVCVLIFYSHRNKTRKFQNPRSSPNESHHSRERVPQDNHIIDLSSVYRCQQQRRLHEHSPGLEQSPPSYDYSVGQTRRQQLPLFTPIRTTPIIPSIHSAMPPSYAEIFLTSHTSTNR